MKLPDIQYGGVRQMPINNTSLPLQAADAYTRASHAGMQAMGNLMQTAGDIVNKELKFQVNNADYEFRQGEAEWLSANAGKDFYDPSELPDDLQTLNSVETVDDQGNPVMRIPKHEVFPELYKRKLNELMDSAGQKIAAPGIREQWRMDVATRGNAAVTQVTLQNINARKQEIEDIETTRIQTEIDSGNYMVAESLVAGSTLPQHKKVAIYSDLAQKRETSSYADAITEGNVNQIVAYSKALRSDEYAGRLDAFDRMQWANTLDQKIASMRAAHEGASGVEYKILKKRIGDATAAMNAGQPVDPALLKQLHEQGMAAVFAKDPAKMIDFNRAIQTSGARTQFLLRNPLQREQELAAAESGILDENQALMIADLRRAHETALADQKSDTIEYAGKTGLVTLTPLAWGTDKFTESMIARKKEHDVALQQLGTSTGYLTKDEVPQFKQFLDRLPVQGKVAVMQQINQALGEDSGAFYEQFKDKGFGSLPQAGQMMTEGASNAAMLVLDGGDKRRSDIGKALVPDVNSKMLPAIIGKLSGVYPDSATRDSAISGILDVYAALSYEDGDTSGEINNTRLNNAIGQVTGGQIEYRGKVIQPPRYGMDLSSFEDWMERLSPLYITTLGGAKGYSDDTVLKGIQDGDITLESRSRNSYYLRDKANGRFLANASKPNEPLVFTYDEGAPQAARPRNWKYGRDEFPVQSTEEAWRNR